MPRPRQTSAGQHGRPEIGCVSPGEHVDELATRDWAEFYEAWLERGQVPSPSYAVITEDRAIFQGMYLNLAQIRDQVLSSGYRPALVTVVADVLQVPAGTGLRVDHARWRLVARRFQVEADCRIDLDLRARRMCEFVLYCAEQSGKLRVVATRHQGPPVVFRLETPVSSGGVRIGPVDGEVACQDVTWAQGATMAEQVWFRQGMRSQFFVAALLYDAHPELARAQFAWLLKWTGYDERDRDLFLQSASLWALLTVQLQAADRPAFVPALDRPVDPELVGGHVAQARQYEVDLRALRTQVVVDQQFIALAGVMLATRMHDGAYVDALLAGARADVEHAAAVLAAERQALSDATRRALAVAGDFERLGVPEWERLPLAEPVIGLAAAVATFGVGIASMIERPAGGAESITRAVGAAQRAQRGAAEAGRPIAVVAEQLGTRMVRLSEGAQALARFTMVGGMLTGDAVDAGAAVDVGAAGDARDVGVAGDAGDVGDGRSLAATVRERCAGVGAADLIGSREWRMYRRAADAVLRGPISSGAPFAVELLASVADLAGHCQAVSAAQVAAIEAGQRYTMLILQRRFARDQHLELQRQVDVIPVGSAAPALLLHGFYGILLVAKTGLFVAAQAYRDALYYWTLRPSPIRSFVVDGVDALAAELTTLTRVAGDGGSSLAHLDFRPEPMADVRVVVDDPSVVAGLAATGEAWWVMSGDTHPFARFDRVRLTRVRIWLEGARVPENGSVVVRLSTHGGYEDRAADTRLRFIAAPLVRKFTYRVSGRSLGSPDWSFPGGGFGYVEEDGVVVDQERFGYVQPTPFTRWGIRVRGKDLDLSSVTRVVMQVAGSGMTRRDHPGAGRSGRRGEVRCDPTTDSVGGSGHTDA